MPVFSPTRAAMVLAIATVRGNAFAIQQCGVPKDTLKDWRNRLKTDITLQELYERELDRIRDRAYDKIFAAQDAVADAIADAAPVLGKRATDKDMTALSHAFKNLGDYQTAKQVLEDEDA